MPTPPEDAAWAWAAGLFEGEGCIVYRRRSLPARGKCLTLKIQLTDEDVLRRFHEIVGRGKICGPYSRPGGTKPFWAWECSNMAAATFVLRQFWPWLGQRRRAKVESIGTMGQLMMDLASVSN